MKLEPRDDVLMDALVDGARKAEPHVQVAVALLVRHRLWLSDPRFRDFVTWEGEKATLDWWGLHQERGQWSADTDFQLARNAVLNCAVSLATDTPFRLGDLRHAGWHAMANILRALSYLGGDGASIHIQVRQPQPEGFPWLDIDFP